MAIKKSSGSKDNVEDGRSKTHPTFTQNLRDYFTEYTSFTSIHGFRYLGEQKRNIAEKIWWFIVIFVSLSLCLSLIYKTYQKWDSSPVIVSFARSPTPIWQVPFPAVTICPETKSLQSVFNFTEAYHKMMETPEAMTDEERQKFEQVSLVCDNHLYNEGNKTVSFNETVNFLTKVGPKMVDVLWQCKWLNTNQTCDSLFTLLLTEEGVCFTSNMLDKEQIFTDKVHTKEDFLHNGLKPNGWSLDKGYPKDSGIETFPRRAISAGFGAGLTILMTLYEKDLDYICKGPVQGFKLLLHNPAEIPRVSQQYFRAPLNQEVVVGIRPDMMTTSEGLASYAPGRRQCYFPEERQLSLFRVYSQQNCDVECITNFTLAKCGCVAYHMPREESTEICGPGSVVCMHEAQVELLEREIQLDIDTYEVDEYSRRDSDHCSCLPACTSITYNAETSQAFYNWEGVFKSFKVNFSEFPGVQMTRVNLFFKQQQFITSERNELYGLVDFLASCGGLLGLFIGFSIISVMEILYFLTLRLICNVRRYGRPFWSGSEKLLKNEEDQPTT